MRRLAALFFALSLLAGACSDSATTTTTASTSTTSTTTTSTTVTTTASSTTTTMATTTTSISQRGPRHVGEVVIGDDQEPPTLNPYVPGGDNLIVTKVGQAIHAGISDVTPDLELVPELLEELPTVRNGGVTLDDDGTMTVGYRILEEARWADGTPISGDDFAFTAMTLAGLDGDMRGGTPNLYAEITSVEAGPKTFTFTLAETTVLHEAMFPVLIPKHQVEGTDFAEDWNRRPWMSAGPFEFESWEQGLAITLTRNDTYWKVDDAGNQLPYLDRVVFRFIPETMELIDAVALRGVDVAELPPGLDYLPRLTFDGLEVQLRDSVIWEHFNFQLGPNNPNEDSLNRHLDYRRAVLHAIDREALAGLRLFANSGEPMRSYLDAYDPRASGAAWDRYPYDPDRARDLLAGLCSELQRDCAADPPTATITVTGNAAERPIIANEIAAMLQDVGISTEVQLLDSLIFFGRSHLEVGAWDLSFWAWVGGAGLWPLVGIHDVFDPAGPPPDGRNFYRWGTPAVSRSDELDQGPSLVIDEHTGRFAEIVTALERSVDEQAILALAAEAEEILADQAIILPLMTRGSVGAVWVDEIAGFEHNPSQAGSTWNIEWWHRVDG